MSDTATAAPAPSSAPAAEPQQATLGLEDTAAGQPTKGKPAAGAAPQGLERDPATGKFRPKAQAPSGEAQPPPAPKRWKVGDREVEDPDELYALAAQKDVDRRTLEALAREAREARELRAALEKDPRRLFAQNPEKLHEMALQVLRERIEEQNLTPEQRQMRQLQRERDELLQQRQAEEERRQQAERDAATQEARKQLVGDIQEAMKATGLPLTDALAKRVAAKMLLNAQLGLNYPPAVLARQVRKEWESESSSAFAKMAPAQLLKALPFLVERLNELDDAESLRALSKLGEKLRRLNLESLGAAPPSPPAGGQPALRVVPTPGKPMRPEDYDELFERRARGG